MKLPTESARNQTPIIIPTTLAGASLVMALRPTGLRQSSPIVWSRYVSVSHQGLTSVERDTGIRTTNPSAQNSRPHENFAVLDGARLPSLIQIHAKTGARAMMNIEFMDWK